MLFRSAFPAFSLYAATANISIPLVLSVAVWFSFFFEDRKQVGVDHVDATSVVLADGTIISSMNRLIKNNAGYDLKHVFIGSEGTLGVITRLVLRLRERPRSLAPGPVGQYTFVKISRPSRR